MPFNGMTVCNEMQKVKLSFGLTGRCFAPKETRPQLHVFRAHIDPQGFATANKTVNICYRLKMRVQWNTRCTTSL